MISYNIIYNIIIYDIICDITYDIVYNIISIYNIFILILLIKDKKTEQNTKFQDQNL